MIFNEISLGIDNNSSYYNLDITRPIIFTKAIVEMYWRYLRILKTKTKSMGKLNFNLGGNFSYEQYAQGIITLTVPFEFEEYLEAPKKNKKLLILDTIHNCLLSIADEQEIDKHKLQQAYDYCIENNLENRWLLGGKPKRSPSKKYYGAVECYWELEFFQATAIIYNSKKQEIKREILFKEPSDAGVYDWYIYSVKPIWIEKDNQEYLTLDLKNMFFDESKQTYWEINPES